MPVSNPSRRTGPRRSALVVAGLAAALTLGAAAGLGGPAVPAQPVAAADMTQPANPAPQIRTVVTTVYQVTPTPRPAPDVVIHRVVAGGGENENESEGDD
jgi:hypothetical protein